MRQQSSLIAINGLIFGALLAFTFGTSSCGNQMQTTYTSNNTVPTPFGAKSLAPELVACNEDARPLRVAFVVDNTGSNNAKSSEIQRYPEFVGSDGVKSFDDEKALLKHQDFTGVDTGNTFTFRQYAVYKSILRLQQTGLAARTANPNFAGIDIGVAHFPKATQAIPTEEEMKEPVFHFGNDTGLASKMTDVSQIAASSAFNQKIWNMLKFTHNSNGMTPYVTAFSAANQLLVTEKKAGDTRQALMILVTDGLPTDRAPSQIKAARKALGTDVRVVLMSIYDSTGDISDDTQNAAAKSSLEKYFNDPSFDWGKEEHNLFSSYWSALLGIPKSGDVRDDYIQVKSNQLNKSIEGVLDRYVKCKK